MVDAYLALGMLLEDLQLGRAEGEQVALELLLGDLGRAAQGVQGQGLTVVELQEDAGLVQGDAQLFLARLEASLW